MDLSRLISGKELVETKLSLKNAFKYVQDGA